MDTTIDTSFEDPDRFQPFRASPASARARQGVFAGETPTFGDLLDVVNPLQHLPVIGNLYREWTGDKIGHAARLAGGALFAGPLGLAMAGANVASLEGTGRDIGGQLLALAAPGAAPPIPDAPAPPAVAKTAAAPAAAAGSSTVQAGSVVATIKAQSMSILGAAPRMEATVAKADAPVPSISQQADAALAALAAQSGVPPQRTTTPAAAAAPPSEQPVASSMMAALDAYGAMMRTRAASAASAASAAGPAGAALANTPKAE